MESLSSDDESHDMVDLLKAAKFQKTSKRVWKFTTDNYIITFIGSGPDPEGYDLRIRVPGTDNFSDNSMRVLWKELQSEPNPVESIKLWASANAIESDAPGFLHEVQIGSEPVSAITLSVMPDETRSLRILTWGIAKRQHKPDQSQRNFFVGTMTDKPYGVDLRKFDGRSTEVQSGIAKDAKFNKIMNTIVEAVEKDNLTCISISCTKGRHRSVAVAELLRAWFYPRSAVEHLTIG